MDKNFFFQNKLLYSINKVIVLIFINCSGTIYILSFLTCKIVVGSSLPRCGLYAGAAYTPTLNLKLPIFACCGLYAGRLIFRKLRYLISYIPWVAHSVFTRLISHGAQLMSMSGIGVEYWYETLHVAPAGRVLRRIKQPLPETPGKPLLLSISTSGFFYVHYTTHGTYGLTSHPKDGAIVVECLAQGHTCHDQGSNPHSTDHHQRVRHS